MTAQQMAGSVIDALGGPTRVGALFDPPISHAAVSQWRHSGIPPARLQLLRLLKPEAFAGHVSPPAELDTLRGEGSTSKTPEGA